MYEKFQQIVPESTPWKVVIWDLCLISVLLGHIGVVSRLVVSRILWTQTRSRYWWIILSTCILTHQMLSQWWHFLTSAFLCQQQTHTLAQTNQISFQLKQSTPIYHQVQDYGAHLAFKIIYLLKSLFGLRDKNIFGSYGWGSSRREGWQLSRLDR